jgi:bifunctional non-homologous end joining protein LigD
MFAIMSVSRELKRQVRRYEPCLPRPAKEPPTGPGWIHEIKHDGFRILADKVRLITRHGYDFAERFPLAVAAIAALPARSCIVDSEAIACDANGLSVFDLLRYAARTMAVTLCAFDLIELDGQDLRRKPIEVRKRTLQRLLRRQHSGIAFNRHFDVDGAIVYRQACHLGCEGHRVEAAWLALSVGSAGLLDQDQESGCACHEAGGGRRLGAPMSDDFKIYVDAGQPAILNDGAGIATDCATLQEAVLAWHRLAPEQKIRATVKVIGGPVYRAQEIERLHYGPKPA